MIQLAFDLPRRTALGRADFFVSDSNAAAVGCIDRWPAWPSPALVLHGPPGCGKTHLAHLWRDRAAARILPGEELDETRLPTLLATMLTGESCRIAVDDADRAVERALFHLYNFCLAQRGSLLLTARSSPGSWLVALDDLRSRLRAAGAIEIGGPDDALLGAVLVKHFADRQLRVAPAVVVYLIAHIERSFAAAAAAVAALDAASLSGGRPVTVALARQLLPDPVPQPLPPGSESAVT